MDTQFVKVQNSFFKRDANGQLQVVADKDTLNALKAGQIKYISEATTRSLKFADEIDSPARGSLTSADPSVEAPASTSLSNPDDINTVFKDTFMKTLKNLNNPELKKLQARKENIRTEALLAPADLTGLRPGDAVSQVRNKGGEYSDAIRSVDEAIANSESTSAEDLKKLQTLSELMKSLTPGSEGTTDTKNYEYAKNEGYSGTFEQWQRDEANRKATAVGTANGLPNTVMTKVQSLAQKFGTEQAVQNYQVIAESLDAVLKAGSTPTDDMQRVYAFAKIMDPNSVVRESEYDTVQQYSQAVLQAAGLKAARIFTNTGFLTPEARTFMKTTLQNRLKSSEKSYKNIYDEYGRKINMITGDTDGKEYLTDYSRPFNETSGDGEKVLMTNSEGVRGYVPASQVDAALTQGYKYAN